MRWRSLAKMAGALEALTTALALGESRMLSRRLASSNAVGDITLLGLATVVGSLLA